MWGLIEEPIPLPMGLPPPEGAVGGFEWWWDSSRGYGGSSLARIAFNGASRGESG
jgi:hypothetical protein